MRNNPREVTNSPVRQGEDEVIAYRIVSTPWGTHPENVVCTLFDVTEEEWEDVSSENLSGDPVVNVDTILTSKVTGLTVGQRYRLEVKFTCADGNTYECYVIIIAER